jgi:lysophospholipase L1-like esterase
MVSLHAMSTSQPQPTKRSQNRRFKLVAVLLAVTVFFIVPEVLVRLFSSTDQSSYSAIKFGGDPNSPKLFVRDSELHWTLRKNAAVKFLGQTATTDERGFRTGRPRGAIDGSSQVLCIGDSTTFGWTVSDNGTFADLLESSLAKKQPDQNWIVHNTGVPGYSSHQMRQTAERWIPELKPQVVVICIGNNDAWPARVSDLAAQQGGFASGLVNVLGKSAFLSWAASLLRGKEEPENPIYFADDSVPRVSDDEMAANIEAVIAIAKQHSARVLMLGAPANLHFPPRNMNAEIDKHRALGDRISTEITKRHVDVATKLANDALEKDPSHVYLQWLRAMVTALAVDEEQGRVELERVFERHRYPDRARGTYRQRQQQVAEACEIPFADVNALFVANRGPEDARKLYVDWCHPTTAGHRIMARQLLQWIAP